MNIKNSSQSEGKAQNEDLSKHLQTPESNEMLMEQWEEASGEYKTSNAEFDKVWQNIEKTINPTKTIIRINLLRYAAIFIIGLLIGGGALYIAQSISIDDNYVEISNPKGTRSEIILPDGSKAWLNSNSKLKYVKDFVGNTRDLELTGEAYFKVEHNPLKPFVVSTGDISVTALGTEFYISSYDPQGSVYTGLIDGKIKIDAFEQEVILDEPAALRVSTLSKKIFVQKSSNPEYFAWKDGKLVMNNTNLNNLAKRLEDWYNVDIVVQEEIKSSYTFTLTVRDESLDEILTLMKQIAPIEYRKDSNNEYEIFTKQN